MIKGFRFTNQLSNAEVDARIHQEFLNKNDGIFYGMEISKTNNTITVAEGLCEIAGRPIAVVDSETISIGTDTSYCLLVLEIDLTKDSTKDVFEQVSFKVLESSTNYPSVTQEDINVYNGENSIYQLEFARFKIGSNGITDFNDTRKFLNFNGIYTQIQNEVRTVLQQLEQELASVEDGSAYVLKEEYEVEIAGKVDKVSGKGLSTKDFTDALKAKLEGIATGATKNVVENSLTSTSTVNALSAAQGKVLNEKFTPVALYNNTSGTNGTVTLSSSAANFSYLEVFYKNNDGFFGQMRIYSPNGKKVDLTSHTAQGTSGSLFIKSRIVYISGTSISTADSSRCNEVCLGLDGYQMINGNNYIYITKVIGYK